MGHTISITKSVENYSNIAKKAKLDGIVCSPLEVKLVKNMHGNKFKSNHSRYKIRKKF